MELQEITAKDLDRLISRLLDDEQGEIPCMSSTLRRLMGLDPDSDASMQELAEIILEDYGLINKVLQVVNSSYYRRLNTEITTVTQAVIFLGFNTVQGIAMDMAILDLLPGNNRELAVKVMAEAFLAAGLTQAVEELAGRRDAESVFVASLYRPMARIVTVLQESEIYSRLCEMQKKGTSGERQLVRNFFRQTGYRLAEMWGIPPRLAGYLEGCRQFAASVDARDLKLVRTSFHMSRLILEGDENNEINDVIERFCRDFKIDRTDLLKCLEVSAARTRDKSEVLNALFRDIRVNQIINPPDERDSDAAVEPQEVYAQDSSEIHHDNNELFLDLLSQITEAILENKFSIDQVLLLAVEVIRRGLDPSNIALCLFTPDRRKLVVRYALGEQAGIIRKHLSLEDPLNRSPLKAAFQQDIEVMGTWQQLMPGYNTDKNGGLHANQLCTSPIQVKGRALGCFMVDFSPDRTIDGRDIKKIAQVRRLVVISALQRVGG